MIRKKHINKILIFGYLDEFWIKHEIVTITDSFDSNSTKGLVLKIMRGNYPLITLIDSWFKRHVDRNVD